MGKLTFYFDRTFGKRLPESLHRLKPPAHIRWHQGEGYQHDMPDDEWLHRVGPARWVVLSQDRKFHAIEAEATAIKQHKIRCFYLPCASEDRWISLCNFTKRHEMMMEMATTNKAPFIFELKGNGRFYRVPLS